MEGGECMQINLDNISSVSREDLEVMLKALQDEQERRKGDDYLRDILQSNDFITALLKSEPFFKFCNYMGYHLHKEDLFEIALPKYLELFVGGNEQ